MASVTPGYTFSSSSDPITHTKLNLISQPTVSLGAGEVVSNNLGANLSVSGLTVAADTQFSMGATTDSFSSAISLTISSVKGNVRLISCTGSTASTITPSAGGTAGQPLYLVFATDTTGGNVITFASPFKSVGTYTLTTASKKYTAHFISDGTNFNEVSRSAALS